ncbi:hypothetical protein XENORESO_014200 [Xenotaenia resolanae]|uniref:Uncharacterized protein n=1 Tax=Xenotaenia resolanae TaxID=208358 RepID=A0ABV0WYB4_9TELE
MQKDPRLGVNPRTFLLQGNSATNCATMQPMFSSKFLHFYISNVCMHMSSFAPITPATLLDLYQLTYWMESICLIFSSIYLPIIPGSLCQDLSVRFWALVLC